MRPCGATRAGTQAPPLPISIIFFHASHTNKITIYMQSAQRKPTTYAQSPKRHQPSMRNLPKRNRRGGACVPARTSAQQRFHTKVYLRITYHARGFNDGCALAGRHGRAHRRRPYLSPPNHAVCHYPIGVVLSIAQGRQVQRSLPWVTMQARRLPPWGLYFFSSRIITTQCRMNDFPHAN